MEMLICGVFSGGDVYGEEVGAGVSAYSKRGCRLAAWVCFRASGWVSISTSVARRCKTQTF